MKKYFLPIAIILFGGLTLQRCMNSSEAHSNKFSVALNNKADEKIEDVIQESLHESEAIALTTQANNKKQILNDSNFMKLLKTEYPMNGFFGKDNYKIEYYITEIKHDDVDPSIFHLIGKTRHKKIITAFEGEFVIESISKKENSSKNSSKNQTTEDHSYYNVNGSWLLREDKNEAHSGVFNGKLLADLVYEIHKSNPENSQFHFANFNDEYPSQTKYNNFLLNGNWTNYADHKDIKSVSFTQNIEAMGNEIFKNFTYGEREMIISEKYRKYGWDDLYTNEEWWNDDYKTAKKD